MTLDFVIMLKKHIDTLKLDFPLYVGGQQTNDSISLFSLPGGITIRSFYDGSKVKRLGYEFTVKTKNKQQKAIATLDELADYLANLAELKSDNGSFLFKKTEISSMPSFVGSDESGFFYYRLEIQAELKIKGVV